MAGFLGFCAQCTDLVKGPHKVLPYRGYVEDVSPQEQWDNIPLIGKLQIITLIGMLESYGEGAGCDESDRLEAMIFWVCYFMLVSIYVCQACGVFRFYRL